MILRTLENFSWAIDLPQSDIKAYSRLYMWRSNFLIPIEMEQRMLDADPKHDEYYANIKWAEHAMLRRAGGSVSDTGMCMSMGGVVIPKSLETTQMILCSAYQLESETGYINWTGHPTDGKYGSGIIIRFNNTTRTIQILATVAGDYSYPLQTNARLIADTGIPFSHTKPVHVELIFKPRGYVNATHFYVALYVNGVFAGEWGSNVSFGHSSSGAINETQGRSLLCLNNGWFRDLFVTMDSDQPLGIIEVQDVEGITATSGVNCIPWPVADPAAFGNPVPDRGTQTYVGSRGSLTLTGVAPTQDVIGMLIGCAYYGRNINMTLTADGTQYNLGVDGSFDNNRGSNLNLDDRWPTWSKMLPDGLTDSSVEFRINS